MDKQYDLIIIGAGPAGNSAAIYAARAKLKTLVIDSGESGGQIRITSEVVNYPGILHTSGAELMDDMRKQAMNFGAEQLHAQISKLDLAGEWKVVETNRGTFKALGVILATGSRPRKAGFKGEEAYKGRGIGYCATCDGEFFTGLDVFVIGGGFAAAEEAIFLTRYARKVTVLVREEAFQCAESVVEKVMKNPKIEVKLSHEMVEVSGERVLQKALIRNNLTGETFHYEAAENETFGVFVFAGYEPMSDFVKDQVQVDELGYIKTNEEMETNLPGVYAAGDIRPKKLRQLVTATSDGAVASTNAERYIKEKRDELALGDLEETKKPAQQHASMLDDELKGQLAPIFERFDKDAYLAVLNQGDPAVVQEMLDLAGGLEAMSDKVHVLKLEEDDPLLKGHAGIPKDDPAIVFLNQEKQPVGISYQAVPGGHEFNSFVLALYNVAGPGQTLDEAVRKEINSIETPFHMRIGVTLSCTMCPDVVQGSQIIAVNNPNVTMEVIDISKNAEFRNAYQLMSVPAIVTDDGAVSFGRKSLEELVAYVKGVAN